MAFRGTLLGDAKSWYENGEKLVYDPRNDLENDGR